MTSLFSIPTVAQRAEQYRNKSSYCNNGGYHALQRHWDFIQASDGMDSSYTSQALTLISIGAFAGGATGKMIGKQIEKMFVENPERKGLGGILGQGIGAVLGALTGGYTYMTLQEYNPEFQEWKKMGLKNALKEFNFHYNEDDVLKDFTCSICMGPFDIPFRTPYGGVFDLEEILQCRRDSKGFIFDPFRNAPFSENSLKPDIERALLIQKRILHLMREDIKTLAQQPELKKTLEEQVQIVEKCIHNCYEKGRDQIEERRKQRVVTNAQYKEEIEEFEKLFGEDAQSNMNWGEDWLSILEQRWTYFNTPPKQLPPVPPTPSEASD